MLHHGPDPHSRINRIPRRGSASARAAETPRLRLAAANRFRSRRCALALAAIALGILAHPAYAATIVEVRVGSHPEFTRVVFELDALDAPATRDARVHLIDGTLVSWYGPRTEVAVQTLRPLLIP